MRRRERPMPLVDGVPAELTDNGHPLWADPVAYADYMSRHDYRLDRRQTFGVTVSPRVRRRAAVCGWALIAGIVQERQPRLPDWHRLRRLGLL